MNHEQGTFSRHGQVGEKGYFVIHIQKSRYSFESWPSELRIYDTLKAEPRRTIKKRKNTERKKPASSNHVTLSSLSGLMDPQGPILTRYTRKESTYRKWYAPCPSADLILMLANTNVKFNINVAKQNSAFSCYMLFDPSATVGNPVHYRSSPRSNRGRGWKESWKKDLHGIALFDRRTPFLSMTVCMS